MCPARRRLSVRTRAARSAHTTAARPHSHHPHAELAVYDLKLSRGQAGTSAEWFQQAVREIVRQVDTQTPFLQTVQLGSGGSPAKLATYGVQDSVVAAPEVGGRVLAGWACE